jgi:hypothetical protein
MSSDSGQQRWVGGIALAAPWRMRRARGWIVMLLILASPAIIGAQGTGGIGEKLRDPSHDNVSVDETRGSVLPRYGPDRVSYGQRIILGMLAVLLTMTAILGVFTLVHVFREPRAVPRR